MSIENLQTVLDRIPDFDGIVNLSNTGDPILLDDLPKRVKMIKDAWPKCTINCTSTLAIKRDKAYFQQLFDNGLGHLLLSCYAFSSDDYARLHGSNNYGLVCKNIEYLIEINRKTPLANHFVLRDLNNFNSIYPVSNYQKKRAAFKQKLEDAGLVQVYDKDSVLHMDAALNGGQENHWDIPVPCHVLWGAKAGRCEVRANLDVVPCCLFPENEYVFGNLRTQSLEEIYNGRRAHDFRNALWSGEIGRIPVCRTCYCYDMRASNMEETDRIVAWQSRRVQGMDVIFWGAGQAYRQFAGFFANSNPVAMIVDHEGSQSTPPPRN